jgi:hypothetical protein
MAIVATGATLALGGMMLYLWHWWRSRPSPCKEQELVFLKDSDLGASDNDDDMSYGEHMGMSCMHGRSNAHDDASRYAVNSEGPTCMLKYDGEIRSLISRLPTPPLSFGLNRRS